MQKDIFVAFLSLLISLVVAIGGYEWYQSMKYDRWKADYEQSGDWYGKLTIPSNDETLMWEYRAHGHFENIETNGFGYRDEDYQTVSKPDGVYRVAFIGDSVTLGLFTDYDDIFVRRFEHWARKYLPERNVQALNFSVDGYNTLQVQEMLKVRVLAYQPDKVVYMMCMNDFDFEDASGDKIRYFKKPDSFFIAMLEKFYIGNSVRNYYDYYFKKNRDRVYAAIMAMQQLLKQHGIEFQVALLPVFPVGQKNFDTYSNVVLREKILGYFRQNGIPAIDLLSAFRMRNDPPERYGYDDWHPKALGHQVIAEQLRVVVGGGASAGP